MPIVVSRAEFYHLITNMRSWYNNNGYLIFDTKSYLIDNIENGICNENTNNFTTTYSLRPLLSFSDLQTDIDLELNFPTPFEVFIWIICIVMKLLTKNRCVCPLASYVPSTWDGLIFGNLIYPSGAIPTNLTPLLSVNFYNPDASPLSTMTASVLKAALAIPA